MPEIVILSGKGGTGKTSITGAFAHLAENAILCDLDVDAPDLHLLLQPEHEQEEQFFSGHEARIDKDRCEACGLCMDMCRFDAVHCVNGDYVVDSARCEGCKVCVHFCPAQAIDFPTRHCGSWYVSKTRFGPMVHAQLFPGEENSGLLVSVLKRKAREIAAQTGKGLILCDGAPGIGCPVISSLSGADLVIAVTEPTISGRHDLERVAELCGHFRIPLAGIINKADINAQQSGGLEDFFKSTNSPLIAKIPHDPEMTRAMVMGKVVTEWESACNPILKAAWDRIMTLAYETTTP
ncbi:MAG: ATP-binding protein [Desulfovibrionales bacterium]